jgi:hypothetical protein
VTLERNLLARSDALAKNMGVTRAGMIARGLKAVFAAEGKLIIGVEREDLEDLLTMAAPQAITRLNLRGCYPPK